MLQKQQLTHDCRVHTVRSMRVVISPRRSATSLQYGTASLHCYRYTLGYIIRRTDRHGMT